MSTVCGVLPNNLFHNLFPGTAGVESAELALDPLETDTVPGSFEKSFGKGWIPCLRASLSNDSVNVLWPTSLECSRSDSTNNRLLTPLQAELIVALREIVEAFG